MNAMWAQHALDQLQAADRDGRLAPELRSFLRANPDLTPEKFLELSAAEESPLHRLFCWNDALAALASRLTAIADTLTELDLWASRQAIETGQSATVLLQGQIRQWASSNLEQMDGLDAARQQEVGVPAIRELFETLLAVVGAQDSDELMDSSDG